MEDVINKIINIENEAQKMIDTVEKEKIDRTNALQEKLKHLKTKLTYDAHNKVAAIREKEMAIAEELIVQRSRDCAAQLQKIQAYLNVEGEKWSDDLVKAVLKR